MQKVGRGRSDTEERSCDHRLTWPQATECREPPEPGRANKCILPGAR